MGPPLINSRYAAHEVIVAKFYLLARGLAIYSLLHAVEQPSFVSTILASKVKSTVPATPAGRGACPLDWIPIPRWVIRYKHRFEVRSVTPYLCQGPISQL